MVPDSRKSNTSVTRCTALAGFGAGGLGLALAAYPTAAREATSTSMAAHPMVGIWVVDRDVTTTDDAPSVVV